jgi:hypothetical protein
MNHTGRCKEDSGADRGDLKCWGLAQEVSEEKKVSLWPRDQSCVWGFVCANNVAAFCPCPKNLPKAKLKSYGLTA